MSTHMPHALKTWSLAWSSCSIEMARSIGLALCPAAGGTNIPACAGKALTSPRTSEAVEVSGLAGPREEGHHG